MGLIRTAFWAGVIVMLMPTDEAKQRELLLNAGQKVQWAMTYCDREPVTCQNAQAAWALFVQKAKFATAMVSAVVTEGSGRHDTAMMSDAAVGSQLPRDKRGTLTTADLAPAWGG